MSYNRRPTQKRGGRVKNNFVDNVTIRRPVNNISYAAQLRSNISNSLNTENSVHMDFYNDHKTLYLLCKYYLGNFVTIKTDSEEFNGVLKAVSPDGDFCLTEATVFVNNNEFLSRNEKFKMIPIKDIKLVEAKNVEFNYNRNSSDHDRILTDEEIGNRRNVNGSAEIELTPFYDSSVPQEDNCLNAGKVGAHWFPPEEMFEKNKISFNVKSTYNENLEGYTTQLNKEDPNFERDLIIAQKKALEIENDRDTGHDNLENGEEENEEILFCSVVRSSESHKNLSILDNKSTLSHAKPVSQHIRKYVDHIIIPSLQDPIDPKHNLNPNAREFTPISSSGSTYCDINNISMHMNSMNIQNPSNYPNIIHPQNFIPYSIPFMFPHHMPNSMPIIQNPGIDQFLISRSNIIPNYSMSPFFVPNQCQMAFDPNVLNQMPNTRYENNVPSTSYSIQNEINYDRDNQSNEFANQNDSSGIENIQINDNLKQEESNDSKKLISNDDYDKMIRAHNSGLQENPYSLPNNINFDPNESMTNFQKSNLALSSSHNQQITNQVIAGNPQTYILPTNITHGIRNVTNYPQMMPNQISYIPNFFPRQNPIVAPIHQVIPSNIMSNPTPIHQSIPIQMKQIPPQNPSFQTGFQSSPSFVPVMNPQHNGQNFHTILPGYPPQIPTPINAHMPIPFQHNIPQFPQFITPIQSCNYFTSVPLPPSQPN